MKRFLLVIPFVLVLLVANLAVAQDGEWLAPPEIDGEAVYIPFPVAITLDGDLGDWARIQPVTVTRGTSPASDPVENGSFTFGVAADMENFYIYMTMPDQNIIAGQHGADTWNEDSLEFYLNLSGDRWAAAYQDSIAQFRISPSDMGNTDPAALTVSGTNAGLFDVQGMVFKTADGWGFEAAVPVGAWITPQHGLEIGFQAHANGATSADRDVKLIWSLADTGDNSWQNPGLFGTGLFFEVGQTDVPQPGVYEEPTPVPVVEEVTRVVAVNQTGYLPEAEKYGMIAAAQEGSASWALVDANMGETVLDGTTTGAAFDPASGDDVQVADFSAWTTPGAYRLVIDGVESVPFEIGGSVYDRLKIDALRYFYLNRSGIPLAETYAGQWARPAGHLTDNDVTCFKGTDTGGRTFDGCDYTIDGSGGWYDAGDYGKYVVNGGISVWTLMNLYERFPAAIPDGALNIPESGDGVPDILDEAHWEMEWLLRMQVPDGDPLAGFAFHKLHDRTWAGMPVMPPTEYDNDNTHASQSRGRYVYIPTTAATLNLAASAAQCARIWQDIAPDFASQCLAAAEKAWQAATTHDVILATDTPGAGGGAYGDGSVSDEFFWAAAELFTTTGEQVYLDYVRESPHFVRLVGPQNGAASSMGWADTAALGTITLAMVPNTLPAEDVAALRDLIVRAADGYIERVQTGGYRVPLEANQYYWGSSSSVLNNAIIMALAYDFTGDAAYLDGVAESMDYLLGRNALARSYVSGYGEVAMEHPHHRFWGNQGRYPPPPPGVVAGGPNGDPSDPTALAELDPDVGPAKRYVDLIGSWSTNEVTINWNAPLAWVVTYLDQVAGAE